MIIAQVMLVLAGCGDGSSPVLDTGPAADQAHIDPSAEEVSEPGLWGPHDVVSYDVSSEQWFRDHLPPSDTRVHLPATPGAYPTLIALTCLVCGNDWTDEILTHVASHGYIVAIPQLHALTDVMFPGQLAELDAAAAFAAAGWVYSTLGVYLEDYTDSEVTASEQPVSVIGFSSGGKAAWLLAREYPIPLGTVIGSAPVDTRGDPFGLVPQPLVTNTPIGRSIPTLIIGAGFDPVAEGSFPACAPEGGNHEQFYTSAAGPAYHVVSELNGHVDMFDPSVQPLVSGACPSEADGQRMRDLVKGLVSGFLQQYINGRGDFLSQVRAVALEDGFFAEWK